MCRPHRRCRESVHSCDVLVTVGLLRLPLVYSVVIIIRAVAMSLDVLGDVDTYGHRPHRNGPDRGYLTFSTATVRTSYTLGQCLGLVKGNADGYGVKGDALSHDDG